jgi:hypothetical protein
VARALPTAHPRALAARHPRGVTSSRRAVRGAVAAMAGLSLAVLGACSAPQEEEPTPPPVAETTTVTPTIEPTRSTPPEPVVPIVWPLTGVPTAEVANRPAVAIKVENTSVARPQTGLEQADVVWETIVEFDVSRFVAVFHSQVPAEVGPIRSVRPMDPPIAAPLHGLLVFSGGQPGILQLVANSATQAISHDAGAPGLYRSSARSAPHNVYGNVQTFIDQANAEHAAPPAQQFAFAATAAQATPVVGGTPAGTLSFRLSAASSPTWVFDGASGTWLRSEGSTPASAASGARLAAVNVVAITANHPGTRFGAQNGAIVPTYELVGQGDAVVATGGKTIAGIWKKAADDQPMQLFLPDGQPLLLAPGNTWVELIPAGSGSLTVS